MLAVDAEDKLRGQHIDVQYFLVQIFQPFVKVTLKVSFQNKCLVHTNTVMNSDVSSFLDILYS